MRKRRGKEEEGKGRGEDERGGDEQKKEEYSIRYV